MPDLDTQETRKPPVAPVNCVTCGWPAEGQTGPQGERCCWFCKKYPLPRVGVRG